VRVLPQVQNETPLLFPSVLFYSTKLYLFPINNAKRTFSGQIAWGWGLISFDLIEIDQLTYNE